VAATCLATDVVGRTNTNLVLGRLGAQGFGAKWGELPQRFNPYPKRSPATYRLLDARLVYLVPVLIRLACPAPRADRGQASPPVGVRFERGPFEGRGLTECRGGRVKLMVGEKSASLYDTKTCKEIGAPLTFPGVFIQTNLPEIACWAFSPDGKLVAIGCRYDEGRKVDNTRIGHIRVWDTATGALVAEKPGQTGPIRRLAFTKDGWGVLFEADPYEIDGP
jgi:hypothetical protein